MPGRDGTSALSGPFTGGALVWIAEIEAARGGGTVPEGGVPHGAAPHGAMPLAFVPAGGTDTIRISDLGWRSAPGDAGGVRPYPPLLIQGPDVERRLALPPGAAGTYAWGSLRIAGGLDLPGTSLAGRDTAMRAVRVRVGRQRWAPERLAMVDPTAAELAPAFAGLARPWLPRTDGAEVPLRDPTAWLDTPLQARRFLGTGGMEGTADLAGVPFPLVRGGAASSPVRSCPVVLVDAVRRIYRWNDGPGTLAAVLEDGVPVYSYAGDVADPFAVGSPGAGAYFSSNATGQFRLGSDPGGAVTVDAYAGLSTAADLVAHLIQDVLRLPAGLLDIGSVYAVGNAFPWAAGWAWTGQETGRQALAPLLAALGADLPVTRAGALRLWALRALGTDARPVARYDAGNAVAMEPVPLDAPLSPPAASWAVGYGRTHVTTTSPKPTVSAADRERLSKEYRQAAWTDPANLLRYAQPSQPDQQPTALLDGSAAAALAAAYGALWGVPRLLWQVTTSAANVLSHEIGDVVQLVWPADGLRSGALGQVVGDGLRAGQPDATLLVLI
jgi:hypothetical protein